MKIDFTNPVIIRKWLSMLSMDNEIGYLLRPNISYSNRKLGFSINSNRFGLRGPDSEFASNVILGTSYGMGFGVDQGCNWYDQGLDFRKWFNAALPVGLVQWGSIFDRYDQGNYDHVFFVYHPNFMQHGVTYLKWTLFGKRVFAYSGFMLLGARSDSGKL